MLLSIISKNWNQNQTFHYTRRITPKRVTSLRRQGDTATSLDVETVANRLQRCVRFGRPTLWSCGNPLSKFCFSLILFCLIFFAKKACGISMHLVMAGFL